MADRRSDAHSAPLQAYSGSHFQEYLSHHATACHSFRYQDLVETLEYSVVLSCNRRAAVRRAGCDLDHIAFLLYLIIPPKGANDAAERAV